MHTYIYIYFFIFYIYLDDYFKKNTLSNVQTVKHIFIKTDWDTNNNKREKIDLQEKKKKKNWEV